MSKSAPHPACRGPNNPAAIFLLIVVLPAWALLSGCAGQPSASAQRYLLGRTDSGDAPPSSVERSLRITRLRLAPFLRGDGIVMQTSEVAIHQARSNLWAEDLAVQLRRSLHRGLARRLTRVRVLDTGDTAPAPGQLRRLDVEVNAFNGRYDGVAVVHGQWRLRNADGEVLRSHRFALEKPLQADGYQALVEALTAAWHDVAAEIAPVVARSW